MSLYIDFNLLKLAMSLRSNEIKFYTSSATTQEPCANDCQAKRRINNPLASCLNVDVKPLR